MTTSLETVSVEELAIAVKVLLILPLMIDCDAKKYREIEKTFVLVRDVWASELNKSKTKVL